MTETRPGAASAAPELGPALRRAMMLLAPAASAFAVGALIADFVFADPAMGRISAVLAVGAAIFAIAGRLLQRGLVRPAALLLTVRCSSCRSCSPSSSRSSPPTRWSRCWAWPSPCHSWRDDGWLP